VLQQAGSHLFFSQNPLQVLTFLNAFALAQGKSIYTLMERIKEAIDLCPELESEELNVLQFIGIQRIKVG
jgi:hypothetical protein